MKLEFFLLVLDQLGDIIIDAGIGAPLEFFNQDEYKEDNNRTFCIHPAYTRMDNRDKITCSQLAEKIRAELEANPDKYSLESYVYISRGGKHGDYVSDMKVRCREYSFGKPYLHAVPVVRDLDRNNEESIHC